MNKYFIALAGILTFGLVSCTNSDYAPYEPAQKESGAQVYFSTELPASYNLKNYEKGSFQFDINRVDASSDASIGLTVEADPAFTVAKSVTFAAGETSASVKVSWDDAKVVEATDYTIKVSVNDQTTAYGNSAYSFTVSKPASWTLWKKGHVYEITWQEDYATALYYQETDFENIWYCMLKDAWWQLDGGTPVKAVGNYYFYWDTKTNNLFVPLQHIGLSNSSGDIAVSDAADFYNAYQGWGVVVPSEDYFSWAPAWMAKNDFFQPYYDGNGGFYLADWMFLCKGGVPTGSGYQFGGNPDYFIADGFVRTTDFNDDKHYGSSAPLFTGEAASMFFSADQETPEVFDSFLRWTEPEDAKVTTTTYYLGEYFGQNNCLAFTAPVWDKWESGSAISDVENDQNTGLTVFGNEIWVSVKGGSINKEGEGDNQEITINITLKVYCKDADGNKTYDFGTVEETFTPTGILKDNYTWNDIYGGYFKDYLGKWYVTSEMYSNTPTTRTYEINILDGGDNTYKIANLSGFGNYFADTLIATYDSKYYVMAIHPQTLDATYSDQQVSMYLLDPDARKIYSSSKAEIDGGICTDGNLAFVNIYSDINLCGFYYMAGSSGLCGVYYAWGSTDAPAAPFKLSKRKEYVTAPAESQPVPASVKFSRVPDNKVTKDRSFNMKPIVKSGRNTEISLPSNEVVR